MSADKNIEREVDSMPLSAMFKKSSSSSSFHDDDDIPLAAYVKLRKAKAKAYGNNCDNSARKKRKVSGNSQKLKISEITKVKKRECERQDEVQKKKMQQREVEEYEEQLEEKEAELSLVEGLIREGEQELKTQRTEFHQVLSNVDQHLHRKEGELEGLLRRIVECTKKLRAKEEELDAMQKLLDGKELQLERSKLLRVISIRTNQEAQVKMMESKKKQLEGQIKELELKEKDFEGKLKELQLEEKRMEGRVEEFMSKEKRLEGREKELASKLKEFEGQKEELESSKQLFGGKLKELRFKEEQFEEQLKELNLKQKQVEVDMKGFESIKSQFEGQVEELKFKNKQYEALIKSLEEDKVQDNQSRSTTDGASFQSLSSEQANETELLANEILGHLRSSPDPAKLILTMITDPIVPRRKEDKSVTIEDKHIFVLQQLMKISPQIKPHVREEAKKLAVELKANVKARNEDTLDAVGFLLILSIYGLVSSFSEDQVLEMFEIAAHHKQVVELFQILGFVDKISDFVENLIKNQRHIGAVGFICAYKLTRRNQPVDLLREHVRKTKLICESRCKKSKSIEIKAKARDEEIASLQTVLRCISDHKLECEDLVREIEDHIQEYSRLNWKGTRLGASGPASSCCKK